jgi:hypothetical protein
MSSLNSRSSLRTRLKKVAFKPRHEPNTRQHAIVGKQFDVGVYHEGFLDWNTRKWCKFMILCRV